MARVTFEGAVRGYSVGDDGRVCRLTSRIRRRLRRCECMTW